MGNNTRIYNHFDWWAVADCDCVHCVNYAGKNDHCPLEACCCDDIRQEALRRGQGADNGATGGEGAMPCPA